MNRKRVASLNRNVTFRHRDDMNRKTPIASAHLPVVPPTPLPVDCTGNQKVSCPMDGNDVEGDCGEAMAAHADNILTFGQGKPGFTESSFTTAALEQQYLKISGGDNGMDEDMVVGPEGVWTTGIAGNAAAVAVDRLDVDVTNVALARYLIDQFYMIQMAWSVPDKFLDMWTSGSSWLNAMTPDPANGHYTPLTDVNAAGDYTLYTWGGYAFVSPAFVASVQPQCFVAFSPRQFNAQGYDSHGRHVSTQAAAWVALGGNAVKVDAVVAMFPPVGPTPPTPPTPVNPPTPAPTPLFTITVAKAKAVGQTVIEKLPVAMPIGVYGVVLLSPNVTLNPASLLVDVESLLADVRNKDIPAALADVLKIVSDL